MNVALVIISDRGDLYLPQMLASMDKYVDYPWSITVTVDDRTHELGMAGAVAQAWKLLPKDTDYVFHAEEDFVFLREVPVERMCRTIEYNTHLAQMVLKRGPWSTEEHAAGGMIETASGEYVDTPGWLEHKRLFSLNPCVYPYWVTTSGVPSDPARSGIERVLTDRLLAQGMVFGIWGSRAESPYVEHVGHQRAVGWRY